MRRLEATDGGLVGGDVADVALGELHRMAQGAELGLELAARFGGDVDEAHLAALLGEGADDAFPDARGAAGDDDGHADEARIGGECRHEAPLGMTAGI